MKAFLLYLILVISVNLCFGSHFKGGTISWKSIGGQNVEFKFKMGWSYGRGPGCTETRIGQYVHNSFIGDKSWRCVSGCGSLKPSVGSVFYTCTAADKTEDWELGESSFNYTFTGGSGPFTVSYIGAMWMTLAVPFSNYDGGWNLQTIVDLNPRSDTSLPNNSPITASKALYTLQFECQHKIQIPMVDPDGDNVKCRWAVGEECHAICNGIPNVSLDEDTCTLSFNADTANFKDDGWYAAALTIEDFPKQQITIGGNNYNSTMPMSSVPLQFLIHIVKKPLSCDEKPIFVPPTPAQGSRINVAPRVTINTIIYASNIRNPTAKIISLSLTSPPGMTNTGPHPDLTQTGVVYWELKWTPTADQKGDNIICGRVEDDSGQLSDTYCFTFIVHAWDVDKCASKPCQHGTCTDQTSAYRCTCQDGFTGINCGTDIDECSSSPCKHGGLCMDKVNGFQCFCSPGYSGTRCENDINECGSAPCLHGETCTDKINDFDCSCVPAFIGKRCQTGMILSEKAWVLKLIIYKNILQ